MTTIFAFVAHAVATYQSLPVVLQLLLVLVGLMTIDILVAVIIASWEGRVSSKIAWRGISRKALTLLAVATAATLQPAIAHLPTHGEVATGIALGTVIGWYILVELCSIVESFGKAGMEIPLLSPFARRVTYAMNPEGATPSDLIALPKGTVLRPQSEPQKP